MIIKSFTAVVASVLCLQAGPAFSQGAVAPQINPQTGLPQDSSAQPGALDPATGLPASSPGTTSTADAIQAGYQTGNEISQLISDNRYEDALKCCLAFHDQYKTAGALIPLLNSWLELGRRFPQARVALIDVRDRDVREFSAGRGYLDLFSEIKSINDTLQQDDATYGLFKSFRDTDPALARQCYFFAEPILMAHGDYQWCYDHMGTAQRRFDSIRASFTMQLDNQKRIAAMNQANQERLAEMRRQHGLPDLAAYSPPDTSATLKRVTEDGFVGQCRRLIEILVATGHQADAEKIRDQAVSVLDDDRLKSAVADAGANLKK